uniref:Monoglyceride lipase-like n=1 Tax=Crassostrea virginica TaxID=6565 RepID=A0A8B8B5E5_CRAVI|nr:monoglyceride lipase-like [Crassostrea virginica]
MFTVWGTIAILAALERPNYFNGIITSAPLVIPTNGFPSKFKIFHLKYVTGNLHPERVLSHIDPTQITRDPVQRKKLTDDRLFRTPIKARWTKAWYNAVGEILQNLKSLSLPFFAFHGDADQISDVKFSQKMFDKARSCDKELKIYPGFFHAPLYESEENRKQVLNDIKLWLEKRI